MQVGMEHHGIARGRRVMCDQMDVWFSTEASGSADAKPCPTNTLQVLQSSATSPANSSACTSATCAIYWTNSFKGQTTHLGGDYRTRALLQKGWLNPTVIKQHLLNQKGFPIHGRKARYIAIKSNPRSREMYARFSIPCLCLPKEGSSLQNETRIVNRHTH
jgi:hypothetical protein